MKCTVGDGKLKQRVCRQVNLVLYQSYQFVTGVTDRVTQSRISVQRTETVTANLYSTEELMTDAQRLRHLISEKGLGLYTGARDVTEGAPRKARVTAKFGSRGEGVKWNGQPATELLRFFSSDIELKSEQKGTSCSEDLAGLPSFPVKSVTNGHTHCSNRLCYT